MARTPDDYKLTIKQPAALTYSSQVTQDDTGHDVIRYQLTLIDTGLHQQAQFWNTHTQDHLKDWLYCLYYLAASANVHILS